MVFMKRKFIGLLVTIIAVTGMVCVKSVLGAREKKEVSILFTHDMHSHLDVEKVSNNGGERRGLAKVKTVKKEMEKKYPNTFLLDGGDFSMGTPFQTIFRERAGELKAMAEVGFDATTLGNHEFDYRTKGLTAMINEATTYDEEDKKLPEIVAANIDWKSTLSDDDTKEQGALLKEALDKYGVKEYKVIEKGDVKIAVFGLMGKEAIEDAPLAGIKFSDYIDSAKKTVKTIKEKEDVDLIVCLSHSGTDENNFKESEDVKLAEAVPDIDVIISGHSHTKYENGKMVGNTLIASCGEYNDNIGYLRVKKTDDGLKLQEYKLIKLDENVENDWLVDQYIKRLKDEVDEIFFSRYNLRSEEVLATSDFSFKDITEIGKVQGEEPLANLITDAYLDAANKTVKSGERSFDIAISPAGTIRASIDEGDITAENVFNISSLGIGEDENIGYPLVDVYLTGKEIKAMAEVDASISDDKQVARIYTSGLSYKINRKRLFLNRAVDFALIDKEGNKIGEVESSKLYRVVGGLYTCQMLSIVKDSSFGLLSIEPKDENGEPIKDYSKRIIKDSDGNEVKEWYALAQYIKGFDGGKVPDYYKTTHNRKIVADSYSPIQILKQPNHIAIMLAGIILIPIVIIAGIVLWIRKRKRQRRGYGRSMFSNRGKLQKSRYGKKGLIRSRKNIFGKRR